MSTSPQTELSPFLELPPEVRLNIYTQYFRMMKVNIHNPKTVAVSSHPCTYPKQNDKSLGLLITSRLISQEATPVFIKETQFIMNDCDCWYGASEDAFAVPPINNLLVEDFNWGEYYDYNLRSSYNFLAAIVARLKTNHTFESLVCERVLWESLDLDSTSVHGGFFEVMLAKGSLLVRNLNLSIVSTFTADDFDMSIVDHECVEVKLLQHAHVDTLQVLRDFFKRYGLQVSDSVLRKAIETAPSVSPCC